MVREGGGEDKNGEGRREKEGVGGGVRMVRGGEKGRGDKNGEGRGGDKNGEGRREKEAKEREREGGKAF